LVRDLIRDVNRLGGVARRSQLIALGASAASIKRSVAGGLLESPRRGWMCSSLAPAEARRAVELGGILGGWSALRSHGIWTDGADLVVATAPTASRLPPLGRGERRVWSSPRFPDSSGRLWRVSVIDALIQHAGMVDRPSLIASIDSALHQRGLGNACLLSLISALPECLRGIRPQLESRWMSGTESKLRIACISAGLRVEPQSSVNHVGFVDLLIDGWLIVEVDSGQFHDQPTSQHRDRVRDGNAVLGNYGHLRFDYQLVQFELDSCLDVILAQLKMGRPE
jgi:very-short-patch-repair endonuclease